MCKNVVGKNDGKDDLGTNILYSNAIEIGGGGGSQGYYNFGGDLFIILRAKDILILVEREYKV